MKKKIIIFTSSGGSGHSSATKAIKSHLKDAYHIKEVFIFTQVFNMNLGPLCGEKIYNSFLHYHALLNFIYVLGTFYSKVKRKAMIKKAVAYLQKEKPDLIISVIPIVNDILLSAAQTLQIPFLLIPTDLDVSTFVQGIYKPKYDRFILLLGMNDPLIKEKAISAVIDSKKIEVAGLPVRSDFFEEKNRTDIKKEYNIPTDKPVIMVMMGGLVHANIYSFAHELAQLPISAHLIFCVGNSKKAYEKVNSIVFNPNLTTTIITYTERISDLFAIADLLITKSGSASFYEGVLMNIPMILDATTTILYWERLNHRMLENYKWGISLKNIKKLNESVLQMIEPANHRAITDRIREYPKHRLDKEIRQIVKRLIE